MNAKILNRRLVRGACPTNGAPSIARPGAGIGLKPRDARRSVMHATPSGRWPDGTGRGVCFPFSEMPPATMNRESEFV